VLQNQSFVAPFPSFSYEDIGLIVKAKPFIYATGEVRLDVNMEIRALGAQSFNGVPVISNRQYTGSITIKDGEAGVVTGSLDNSEQNSLTGLPGIAHLPVLGTLTASHNKQTTETELLVLITPHITRTREASPPAIMIPSS
jgi:general secretion pathway protein D